MVNFNSIKGMHENVQDWYLEHYPNDTLGYQIHADISFSDLYVCLNDEPSSFYDVVGEFDSVIRERIFSHLADLLSVTYDTIYEMWVA